jgi:putative spermidine/putrescine transport system permease protein
VDRKFDQDRNIIQVAEDRRIHKILWLRTLNVAFWVTVFCFILAVSNFALTSYFTNEI